MTQPTTRANLASAVSDWRGCGCCSTGSELADLIGDDCTEQDGWTDHTYGDGCVLGMDTSALLARVFEAWKDAPDE